MSGLRTHFIFYAFLAFLNFVFITIAYNSQTGWASTSGGFTVTTQGGVTLCYADVDIYTGMFDKRVEGTVTSCTNATLPAYTYDDTSELGCFTYSDDSEECQSRDSAANALKASTFFTVIHLLLILWPVMVVRQGENSGNGINAEKLKTATYCMIFLCFPLFICCFVAAGNYRYFLTSITSFQDVYGNTYSIDWTMNHAWTLTVFAGIFAISLFFSNMMLLYAISRAQENNSMVYRTSVIVHGMSTSVSSSTSPPVVQGVVVQEPAQQGNTLRANLI